MNIIIFIKYRRFNNTVVCTFLHKWKCNLNIYVACSRIQLTYSDTRVWTSGYRGLAQSGSLRDQEIIPINTLPLTVKGPPESPYIKSGIY